MKPPVHPGENTPLSHTVLLTAAEQVWPGQVPQGGSLGDVAKSLKGHMETFPCLQGHTVVEGLLKKLDTVKTNGDFITVTEEIFRIVGTIRKSLETSGILRHATQPYEPMIATVSIPNTLPGAMPLDTIKRLQANAAFLMILHYANRILSVLIQASLTIQNKISEGSQPTALIDAQPLAIPGEKIENKKTLSGNNSSHKTRPEEFRWCGIDFDKRMILIPILSKLYLQNRREISFGEIEAQFPGISAISTKANKIGEKFTAAGKSLPFRVLRGKLEFIYDASFEADPVQSEGITGVVSSQEIPEDLFLSEVFDPQTITNNQPLKIKDLTDDAIDGLEFDETGRTILKALFNQIEAIHISELATQCQTTISEINAYVALILQVLWSQGFVTRIEVENDFIRLIK